MKEIELTEMANLPLAPRPCVVAASLEVLGERWSLLAIRELAYGVHRFDKLVGYTGASRDILADRLRKLEAAGVVERRQYSEHPPRYEYHLTEAGRELSPVMMALNQWGTKWIDAPKAAVLTHDCGHPLDIELTCRHCAKPITRATTHAVLPNA